MMDDSPFGYTCVGKPRRVTCRNPRPCNACNIGIRKSDSMYMWNTYSFGDQRTRPPIFLCFECLCATLKLIDKGVWIDVGAPIKDQLTDHEAEEGGG